MWDLLIDFIMDIVGDLLLSFRGKRFYGKEWLQKLCVRIAVVLLFGLGIVLAVAGSRYVLLILLGICLQIVALVVYFRADKRWLEEYIARRKKRAEAENCKESAETEK